MSLPGERQIFSDWAATHRAEMAAPEFDEVERDLAIEREVFSRLCAHWFSAGPNPEEVVQRVFHAALDRRPDLLRGMSTYAVAMATEESSRGRRWRLKQLFADVGSHWRERYRVIVETLAAAFDKAGRPEIPCVTLNEALSAGMDAEPEGATELLSRVLDLFFALGADLRDVARLAFTWSGWLGRDRQLNMSLEEVGTIFDETRAAQSWRAKEIVEAYLRRAGCRGFRAPWQKGQAAVDAYTAAAKGNHNRANGTRPARKFPDFKPTNKPTHANLHPLCQSQRDTESGGRGEVVAVAEPAA